MPPAPEGWGNDEVTSFFDALRTNSYATYERFQPWVQKIIAIDGAYRKLTDNLFNTRDWFSAFFFLRAHSNFLAATTLAFNGQFPETFALLRSCLESGLYGLYFAKNPDSRRTWLERHESAEHMAKVRQEFKPWKMIGLLRSLDRHEAEVAQTLYDRAIDFGAHPNERGFMSSLQLNEDPENYQLLMVYASDDPRLYEPVLKSVAQIGVCVLSIFKLVYRERYDIINLSDTLHQLRQGL